MSRFFAQVPLAPPNPILGLALECKNDSFGDKIDLAIGAYRDDNGKPVVLPVVREAEEAIFDHAFDHEYLSQVRVFVRLYLVTLTSFSQDGLPGFLSGTQKLLFGDDSKILKDKHVYSIQGISGTGSVRLGVELLGNFFPDITCFCPEVTWPNHEAILDDCHVKRGVYRYLDSTGCKLNFEGLIQDLQNFPKGSVVLFHSCAHNPTGVDPDESQWREILRVCLEREFLPFFDNAYQGFVSGCPVTDAFAVRLFADSGISMLIACSFAKNFGLYGERAGVLHVVSDSSDELASIASQLRVISRALYSTCPTFGARIVSMILNNEDSRRRWEEQCGEMAARLTFVRNRLFDALVEAEAPGSWEHVKQQRGMFSYTGIPSDCVARLKSEFHIYMLANGRISLAGLNTKNIDRFAQCVAQVLKDKAAAQQSV